MPVATDPQVTSIQRYLQGKGSPLAPYANVFVEEGRRYGVDPRFLVAITGIETNFGRTGSGLSNPTGYASATRFGGVRQAVSRQARAIGAQRDEPGFRAYYRGARTVADVGRIYSPVGASNDVNGTNGQWIPSVTRFYREQGGDPNGQVRGLRGGQLPTTPTTRNAPASVAAQRSAAQASAGVQQQSTAPTVDPGKVIAAAIVGRQPGQSISKAVVGGVMAAQSAAQAAQSAAPANPAQAQTQTPGVFGDRAQQRQQPAQGGKGAAAFNAARGQLGIPYSWGGGGPGGPSTGFGRGAGTRGFDCSSLMQYAYARIGIKIPRTTYEQIKVGRAINPKNPNQWQVGDLLFPHTGHVQMYVGNGKVIEAPQTGGHVQIVGLRDSYTAVRRVV